MVDFNSVVVSLYNCWKQILVGVLVWLLVGVLVGDALGLGVGAFVGELVGSRVIAVHVCPTKRSLQPALHQ